MSQLYKVRIVWGHPQVWIERESLGIQFHQLNKSQHISQLLGLLPQPGIKHKKSTDRVSSETNLLSWPLTQKLILWAEDTRPRMTTGHWVLKGGRAPALQGQASDLSPKRPFPKAALEGNSPWRDTRKGHSAREKALRLDATAYGRAVFRHFWDGSMVR